METACNNRWSKHRHIRLRAQRVNNNNDCVVLRATPLNYYDERPPWSIGQYIFSKLVKELSVSMLFIFFFSCHTVTVLPIARLISQKKIHLRDSEKWLNVNLECVLQAYANK